MSCDVLNSGVLAQTEHPWLGFSHKDTVVLEVASKKILEFKLICILNLCCIFHFLVLYNSLP
jgi:hypothetical protein